MVEHFHSPIQQDSIWPGETWQDYPAPIIRQSETGKREALLGTFGIVPKKRMPEGAKRFTTMNARVETVGQLRSYSLAWKKQQLCLVPMLRFFEPNFESGSAVR